MMQDSEFVSLTSVLEPWFEKDRSELPGDWDDAWRDSRQAASMKFLLSLWDGLSTTQRRTMAAQFDASGDPAKQNERREEWDLVVHQFNLQADLDEIETGPTKDVATRQERRDDLKQKITAIDARLSKPATGARAAAGEAGGSPVEPTPTEGCAPDSGDRTPPVYKTGGQGRPTSMNLIAGELARRREAGEVHTTQAAEAKALAAWLAQAHPQAPRAGVKAIGNSLGKKLREAVDEAKTRKERPK
jgi:hypothetical protein